MNIELGNFITNYEIFIDINMLQVARNAVLKPTTFHFWTSFPKDIRWLIIRIAAKFARANTFPLNKFKLHTVSIDFFKAIYSQQSQDELFSILFNVNDFSRPERYEIYKLLNLSPQSPINHKLLYLEFEYSIICSKNDKNNKNNKDERKIDYKNYAGFVTGIKSFIPSSDYVIGLINYVTNISKNLGKHVVLNYLRDCRTIDWITTIGYTSSELLDLIQPNDIKDDINSNNANTDNTNTLQLTKIISRDELKKYAAKNLHIDKLFDRRLAIYYLFDIPINVNDFIVGMSQLDSYYKLDKFITRIYKHLIDMFMNEWVYRNLLQFDRELSQKELCFLILTLLNCSNSSSFQKLTTSEFWDKLINVSGLCLFNYHPEYSKLDIMNPNDTNFIEKLHTYLKDRWNESQKIQIVVRCLTVRFNSDPSEFADIICKISLLDNIMCSNFLYILFSNKLNSLIDFSLLNTIILKVETEYPTLVNNLVYSLKRHDLKAKVNCQNILNMYRKNQTKHDLSMLETLGRLPKNEEKIDALLRLLITKKVSESNMKKFQILYEYYNTFEDRIERYNKIIEDYSQAT